MWTQVSYCSFISSPLALFYKYNMVFEIFYGLERKKCLWAGINHALNSAALQEYIYNVQCSTCMKAQWLISIWLRQFSLSFSPSDYQRMKLFDGLNRLIASSLTNVSEHFLFAEGTVCTAQDWTASVKKMKVTSYRSKLAPSPFFNTFYFSLRTNKFHCSPSKPILCKCVISLLLGVHAT